LSTLANCTPEGDVLLQATGINLESKLPAPGQRTTILVYVTRLLFTYFEFMARKITDLVFFYTNVLPHLWQN